MQSSNQKRFYSPQFSATASISVRRLAWAMGKPMPATIDLMVKLLPSIVNPAKVCQSCKDSTKCPGCTFHSQFPRQEQDFFSHFTPQEQKALEAVV
jgi:recombinational DNA repair protein RecR